MKLARIIIFAVIVVVVLYWLGQPPPHQSTAAVLANRLSRCAPFQPTTREGAFLFWSNGSIRCLQSTPSVTRACSQPG